MALTPIHLRLEANDGGIEEYRVYDEQIETRRLNVGRDVDDNSWHRVTPKQLTAHVNRNTVVAKWLQQRMGWRRVLRACLAEEDRYLFEAPSQNSGRHAA